MSELVTVELFQQLFPKSINAIQIQAAFAKYFAQYEINTTNRRAGFLAQCAYESNNFTVMVENLNYSTQGLITVFHKYFPTIASTEGFNKQAEKIANKVYANRMGNKDEDSGDGYKYRGRGFIQLTGHDNYKLFADYKNITIDDCVKYLETIEGAVESALWYWKVHNLNKYCDNDDIIGMTKAINGGTIGLEDRTKIYKNIKQKLGV
jgi:putative chitinase